MHHEEYFFNMLTEEERERLPLLETFPELLERAKEVYGTKPAIADDEHALNYIELYENVGKRIQLLDSLGIPAKAHVAILSRNNVDAMCWLLAVPSSDRVVMMLPNMLTAEGLKAIVERYDIDALVVEKCFSSLAEGLSVHLIDAADTGETAAPMAKVEKDTVAAIYLTGGTSGKSKGVVLSHGALMRGTKNGAYRPKGYAFTRSTILMLPLSHIFGTITSFLTSIFTGTEVHGCNDVKSGIMSIPRIRPTHLVLVPGIVEIIFNIAKMKGAEFLGDIAAIQCGGAPVSKKLVTEAKGYGIDLYPGYGLTEGANLTSANASTEEKPFSVGMVYPEQEYKIVDGELWIRGDNVMVGYYKDPEATSEVLTEDGWLKTADLVSIDDDGFLHITGRKDNLIILSNGENVSPEEVEGAFYQSDLIQDCLVRKGKANEQEVLEIEILPVPGILQKYGLEESDRLIRDEVKKINDTLPSFKQVSKITIRTEDFKRTGSLKIDRRNS